jgi:hypothetical protein
MIKMTSGFQLTLRSEIMMKFLIGWRFYFYVYFGGLIVLSFKGCFFYLCF